MSSCGVEGRRLRKWLGLIRSGCALLNGVVVSELKTWNCLIEFLWENGDGGSSRRGGLYGSKF